uniref:SGNH hydrolase-type esterase domain-containing protein n=1 Tax=Takifugu rubripes TaxID=31033 RepID=A0A674PIU4_TAKRU
MMAVCESCLPTFSKLRESISGLQSELKERDKIILESSAVASTQEKHIARLRSEGQGLRVDLLDLSTVAMSQAKHIVLLKASGAGDRSMTATNDTTLPWTGSINAEIPATAPAESRRHRQGAMPKGAAHSSSFLRPTESQGFISRDGAGALVSSTPLKPREPWSVVARGAGACPAPPPPPLYLPLDNRYDILSLQDFPPVGACSSSPPGSVRPAGSHQTRNQGQLARHGPPLPSWSGAATTRRHHPQAPRRHRRTSRRSEAATQVQRTPAVLVVGTSMVRHVAVHDGRTFCHPGARVAEVTSSALQLSAQHPTASMLVLEAGINDLKFQQSEVPKQDFISLVDRLLDMGKRLIISGPLPPPRYGDVITSRLRQLHLWLKGYCLGNSIPFVDNFAAFLNRPHLFKWDGLHPNHEGSRLLSLNIDLTVRSCTTSTS